MKITAKMNTKTKTKTHENPKRERERERDTYTHELRETKRAVRKSEVMS